MLLDESKHTAYKTVAARCIYISADHPDIHFANKDLCRWVSVPTKAGFQDLKPLGRYLEGHRSLLLENPFLRTRKSTGGGCPMLGQHLLKSWSSTQAVVSLSSGEAAFYGLPQPLALYWAVRPRSEIWESD